MADHLADHRSPVQPALDLLRGTLIGAVEVVPGVSGGTVALIVGVYSTLIDAAVRWRIVAPVLIGMVLTVLLWAPPRS